MKKRSVIYISAAALAVVALVLFLIFGKGFRRADSEFEEMAEEVRELFGINLSKMHIDTCVVSSGESLAVILKRYNLTPYEIHEIAEASKEVFDPRNIRTGQPYYICTPIGGDTICQPAYMIYGIDKVNYVVFDRRDTINVARYQKDVITERKFATGTIDGSFWLSVKKLGLSDEFVMKVADIYQWAIDFYGIAAGDSFNIIYDERSVEGEIIGIGNIPAAWFEHLGKRYYAVNYKDSINNGYWDENGASLKKSFLKAPLRYSRISSSFSNSRLHPVLKIYRPHHGVDYAAPSGTPVEAVGDGVVIQRSYDRGGGNTIKIRHSMSGGKYVTGYLHLSKFAGGIRVGTHVKQGQIIGYVGSTGLSTGPHLDYRVWVNGSPVNPLKISQEPGKPLTGDALERFGPLRDSMIRELNRYYAISNSNQQDTLSNNG